MICFPVYLLDEQRRVTPCTEDAWTKWYAAAANRILRTSTAGDVRVCTIFLGMNHGTDSDPVFFLTVVKGGKRDGMELRAPDYKSASENHNTALAAAKG